MCIHNNLYNLYNISWKYYITGIKYILQFFFHLVLSIMVHIALNTERNLGVLFVIFTSEFFFIGFGESNVSDDSDVRMKC